jgi:DNA-binding CsgD family transcriptional regulator
VSIIPHAFLLAAAGQPEAVGFPARPARLTDREAQILGLLARGLATKQIGWELGISPKSAGHHIQNLYGKIGTSTGGSVTPFALQHNLLPSSDTCAAPVTTPVGESANMPT